NSTTRGWYEDLPDPERRIMWSYLKRSAGTTTDAAPALLELAWRSTAALAMAPLQDVLNLGKEARMNQPGSAGGNWRWRYTAETLSESTFQSLRDLTRASARSSSRETKPADTPKPAVSGRPGHAKARPPPLDEPPYPALLDAHGLRATRCEMGNFKEQLEKMRTHPGFIAALDQSGGSTPHALRAYGIKDDAWTNEEQMFNDRASNADTDPDQPGLHRRAHHRRHPVREHHGPGDRWHAHRGLSVGCETGGAVFESGQGPGRGEPRCPVDEADARPGGSAGQGHGQAHLRNQDPLLHQACRRFGHQGHRDPAVRSLEADHRGGSRANRRARSGHSLPGEGRGRGGNTTSPHGSGQS